jgi:DEAD/DEAH box helicase domain-containing protein
MREFAPEKVSALIELADGTLRGVVEEVAAAGCLLPEPGYELASEEGEVVATAELAWPAVRVAVLLEAESAHQAEFETRGWRALPAREVVEDPATLVSLLPREGTT